jgi:uncharacterized protein
MATDKTGATTTVTKEADRFTISVDGTVAGFTETIDHLGRRTFPHTEVDEAFQGRGLASILIGEALQKTHDEGLKIVPVCSMVQAYVEKHPEFDDSDKE